MQRVDLIPIVLLGALAGVVGFRMVRDPHITPAPITMKPAPVQSAPRPPRVVAAVPAAPASADTTPKMQTLAGLMEEPAEFVPSARSDEINRRMRSGAAGTYIFEMLEGEDVIARWRERPTESIHVWVDPGPKLEDWNPQFATAARKGFTRWNAASIPVRVNFVVDSANADVRVHWVDEMEEKRVGVARRTRDGDYWIVSADVVLALHEPGGALLSVPALTSIATHEAGHVLGLYHSPLYLDIMSPGYNRQIEPSPADLMTMRLLYTLPPGRFR